ncbi:hypothetical protein AWR27_16240 [Spirosoma montaniterrae]|uniref:BioF2-like acetyltransferase domain-containing protein n=1 Tax=Spirosoma montaniterrae TaxID=1178516 RepID=A0A1P9X4N1_9BACT|nr:hypothetical protein AWR27_16240 [Spirosoma montaniterrae]
MQLFSTTSCRVPPFHESGFFFNELAHVRQQYSGPSHLLVAVNQQTGRSDARCAFFINNNQAISPIAAPFGSVEFTDKLPDATLKCLLDQLVETARLMGVSALRLVNYPHSYAPAQAERLTTQLLQSGFHVSNTYQNHSLAIDDDPFTGKIHSSERRRLRKCERAGFTFDHWVNPDIDALTGFIAETRRQQGYRLTLTPERLTRLLRQFPDKFPVFVVHDGPALAALTVAVRVRDNILYSFLPASSPDYRSFSPAVMLTNGLYNYCQHQRIQLLDLGVSLDNDRQPKSTLMRFKERLGAKASEKLVFKIIF